ncbi:MAG: glycyl-radical enzyme activating protein [Oscillospiraceae bacterium]|nr:glycyl-radical enzyme activating protein [Oscillospiraceae bacterium]
MTVEVSRGTTHDGPGIRTTVFTKGCPLSCRWCQNPESLSARQEVWYTADKCIGCLECVRACKKAALVAGEDGIHINRGACAGCGGCSAACPAKALAVTSTEWTVDELVREVMRDKVYYDEFGGGVTVSGGEPLMHAVFLEEFFQKLKAQGVHIAMDTCGHVPEASIMKAMSYADAVLFDIKLMDAGQHKALTGRSNELIQNNFETIAAYIRSANHNIDKSQHPESQPSAPQCPELLPSAPQCRKVALWVRTPLIPGDTDTDDNLGRIADYLISRAADVVERWELCTFNAACAAKYAKMQMPWPYAGRAMMKQSEVDKIKALIISKGFPGEKLVVTGLIKQGA